MVLKMKKQELEQLAENLTCLITRRLSFKNYLKGTLGHSAVSAPTKLARQYINDKTRTAGILLEVYQHSHSKYSNYKPQIKELKKEIRELRKNYPALLIKFREEREKADVQYNTLF